jgi:hypothetical protein
MKTLSASQLGTLGALFLGLIFNLIQMRDGDKPFTTFVVSAESKDFVDLFWSVLAFTAFHYLFAEWALEEKRYQQLRTIQWTGRLQFLERYHCRLGVVEFWFRVFLAGGIGVAAAGEPTYLRFGLSAFHASFFSVALIYLGFLFWDLIVSEGGYTDLDGKVVAVDTAGAIIVLGCIWFHKGIEELALFGIIGLLVLLVALLIPVGSELHFWKRLVNRHLQR